MPLWRKVLRGAVRGAGRTTGRALSRYVIPDSVTPWNTRKTASKTVSGIWGFGSRLVKKQAKKIANNRQAAKSRGKLVNQDRELRAKRSSTPYKSPALSRVLRPTLPVQAAPSFWKRLALPSRNVQSTKTVTKSPVRPARSISNGPKKPGRLYVDTETGELYDRPGPGRTWADAPAAPSRNNPASWQRGAKLQPAKEEVLAPMKSARQYYQSGPASIRGRTSKPDTGTNSYSPTAERRSKFPY